MDLDDELCYCFHLTRRKLVNFVRRCRPKVPSQLSECGGAGTGCGWCIPFLQEIFRQALAGGDTELVVQASCLHCAGWKPAPQNLERLSPEEYEKRRAAYIRAGKGQPPPGAKPWPPEETA